MDDLLIYIAMGFAAVMVAYSDYRRDRDVIRFLEDHASRLGVLEGRVPEDLKERLVRVETKAASWEEDGDE